MYEDINSLQRLNNHVHVLGHSRAMESSQAPVNPKFSGIPRLTVKQYLSVRDRIKVQSVSDGNSVRVHKRSLQDLHPWACSMRPCIYRVSGFARSPKTGAGYPDNYQFVISMIYTTVDPQIGSVLFLPALLQIDEIKNLSTLPFTADVKFCHVTRGISHNQKGTRGCCCSQSHI